MWVDLDVRGQGMDFFTGGSFIMDLSQKLKCLNDGFVSYNHTRIDWSGVD